MPRWHQGAAALQLGDYGTSARIVDWDQLPNGLLGVTIEGGRRFDLHATSERQRAAGRRGLPRAALRPPGWRRAGEQLPQVLRSLQAHFPMCSAWPCNRIMTMPGRWLKHAAATAALEEAVKLPPAGAG